MKISSFSLLCLAAISIVACGAPAPEKSAEASGSGSTGNSGGPQSSSTGMKIGIVFDSGGRGDKSFNDSAWKGIQDAQKPFQIADADIKSVDSRREKDYEGNLSALAEGGCKIVFAIGLGQKAALEKVAPRFPDIKFAIIDSVVDLPNVRSAVFNEEEGSFLAGYAAALTSKTGKIGFVGGKKIPLIVKFETGYIAGAKTANPAIEVLPSKYTESWDDTAIGKASASALFSSGADVVYSAAGRCGLGVIAAAKETGKFAIGVDSNQDGEAPGNVLTSMIKRVDSAVFQTIKDVREGSFKPGTTVYDLKADGVGLSDFQFTKDKIGAANLKKIDAVSEDIKSGKIKVPSKAEDLAAFLAKK